MLKPPPAFAGGAGCEKPNPVCGICGGGRDGAANDPTGAAGEGWLPNANAAGVEATGCETAEGTAPKANAPGAGAGAGASA